MLELLFSKLGAALLGILGILALWLRGSWYRNRAEQAEAQAKVAEKSAEAIQEERKRHEQVDKKTDDELVDYWRRGGGQ